MIMLSIFPVVTASSVFHSAEAAQYPDWLWVRDSVQSANAATDCWRFSQYSDSMLNTQSVHQFPAPDASLCHPPTIYPAH